MPAWPQILLPLEGRRPDRFTDFVAGPNESVVAALLDLLDAPEGCLFLEGPPGSGKSHLLTAACNSARERQQSAFYISFRGLDEAAAAGLEGLEGIRLVCIDDIDVVAGNRQWENALFHCFNRLRANSGRLVVSSALPLKRLPFMLPDLGSRLGWGVRMKLDPLDDAAKALVLERRAAARGMDLPLEVQAYLLSRGSRSLAALLATLDAACDSALGSKRKMTVPLVREVMSTGAGG